MMEVRYGEGAEPIPQYIEILKYTHFDWIKDILSY